MRIDMEKMPEQEYQNKIVYISFLCSIMVILLHVYNIESFSVDEASFSGFLLYKIENTISNISRIAVPMFFFLAGYLFYQNFTLNKCGVKWLSRCRTYLIPYILWTMIPYLAYVILTHSILKQYMNRGLVELSMKSFLAALLNADFNVLWFLRDLIIYTAFAPVVYLLLKNRTKFPVGMCSLLVLAGAMLMGRNVTMNLYYALGCYVGLNHKELLKFRNRKLDRACIWFLPLLIVGNILLEDGNKFIWILLEICALWNAMNQFALNKEPKGFLRCSFFIYCTHSLLLEGIEKMILLVLGKGGCFQH